MYSHSVEKKSLLCYPFEYHVQAFIEKDSYQRGRRIVPPGTRYLAAPSIIGYAFTFLHSLGKCRHWSGIFCIFHDFVYWHHKQTVCKKKIGMARKFDFAVNTSHHCDGGLSLIGWLRSTRTRGRIPIKRPDHGAHHIRDLYAYDPFGSGSPTIN